MEYRPVEADLDLRVYPGGVGQAGANAGCSQQLSGRPYRLLRFFCADSVQDQEAGSLNAKRCSARLGAGIIRNVSLVSA